MKRAILWCLTMVMLLSCVSAAARSVQVERMIGELPTAAALLDEMVDEGAKLPKTSPGTPIAKRLLRFYPIINGKKVSSITLQAGEIKNYAFRWVYTNALSYDLYATIGNPHIAAFYGGEIRCIKGLNPGSTKISFVERLSGKKASLKVKVTPIKVTGVYLEKDYYEIPLGSIASLKDQVTVMPGNASNKEITYKSSNKKVATIDQNGYITPKKFGTTTITVTSKQNKKAKAKCTIAVVDPGTDPANPVTYRFYGVGQSGYPDGAIPANKVNMAAMALAYAYSSCDGQAMNVENLYCYTDLTAGQIRTVLNNMALSGADENDVTVFYYAGKGCYSQTDKSLRGALVGVDETVVTVDSVRQYLDKVPGKVVVILESGLSGQFIESKSAAAQSAGAKAVTDRIISAFAASTAKNYDAKALPDSPYASKYKIITACGPLQGAAALPEVGLFTFAAAMGLGADPEDGAKMPLYADDNDDNKVSLNELYRFVEGFMAALREEDSSITQVTQVWPANDNFTLLNRT